MAQLSAADNHHVHFDSASLKDEFGSDNSVTYKNGDEGVIINLGFLQINHRYSIDLQLPSSFFGEIDDSTHFIPDLSNAIPNLNCRITEFTGTSKDKNNFFEMKIEFFAYKEKLLRETLSIVNAKNSKEILKLIIVARVLGKGKGTPMLRAGIHCIGIEKDEESEASDISVTK